MVNLDKFGKIIVPINGKTYESGGRIANWFTSGLHNIPNSRQNEDPPRKIHNWDTFHTFLINHFIDRELYQIYYYK
jgi:hypothetical protein